MRKHYPLDPTTGAENQALLPWSDGIPQTGTPGSYPGQALVTDSEAEILNAQAATGATAAGGDLTQLGQALSRGIWLGTFAGTANALTAVLPNTTIWPQLLPGMTFHGMLGPSVNTGPVTFTLAGFAVAAGTQPVVRGDRSSALVGGDFRPNALVTLKWDGTSFCLTQPTASDITAVVGSTLASIGNFVTGADTGNATGIVVASPSPAVTALRPWMVLVTTPAAVNVGALTINLAGLGQKPVIYPTGSAFLGGEMQGRPQYFIYDGTSWEWQGQQTPVLQQATTFFVSPGGNNSNNGLTVGSPLKDISAAVNRTALFNLNGFNVAIKLADGGYSGPVGLPAISGSGSISIIGNTATPGNVIISSGTQAFVGSGAGAYTINGVRVITTGNSFQMGPGQTWTLLNIDYGPCASAHISIDGGALTMTGQHNISGGATAHIQGINGASLRSVPGAYPTLNVLIGVTFTNAFIVSNTLSNLSLIYGSIAGAANVQGTKKFATSAGLINTLGRGINYYPGDTAGTSVNSWEYQ